MIRPAPLMFALALTATLAACPSGSSGNGATGANPDPGSTSPGGSTPSGAQPGTVSGIALDTQGRPLANAKIRVEGAVTTGSVETRTGADGRYSFTLPDVPYNIFGWTEVQRDGRRYCLRLAMPNPADYDSFTTRAGAVRDFRWVLEGPIPDRADAESYGAGHFGGTIRLYGAYGFDSPAAGSKVELSLTPTGPLIDGSAGQPLTRTATVDPQGTFALDVPVGPYEVSAAVIEADGSRTPLRVGVMALADQLADSVAVDFDPEGDCSYESGVKARPLFIAYP